MLKETCIIFIIIIFVITLNTIAQKYTDKTFEAISADLEELGNEFKTEEEKDKVDGEAMEEKLDIVKEKWEQRYKILAYYIEHDELEKVYTSIVALDGLLNLEEYGNAIAELEKIKYTLEHIKEKYTFTLMNIF